MRSILLLYRVPPPTYTHSLLGRIEKQHFSLYHVYARVEKKEKGRAKKVVPRQRLRRKKKGNKKSV